ncbi:MAG: DNA translocase FtsK 4TM domain-containing protein [Elusimicrobia bacterium]|nr:DNA translocase FtsK 4TM domain-containing protein [Elusimicrobiota bacterium]
MSRRQADTSKKNWRIILFLAVFFCGLWLAGALYYPPLLGLAGRWTKNFCLKIFGWTAYLAPFLLFWTAWRTWQARKPMASSLAYLVHAVFIPSACFLLASASWSLLVFSQKDIAGSFGRSAASGLLQSLGFGGSCFILITLWMAWFWLAFDVPWPALAKKALRFIIADLKSWRDELRRRRLAAQSDKAIERVSDRAMERASEQQPEKTQKQSEAQEEFLKDDGQQAEFGIEKNFPDLKSPHRPIAPSPHRSHWRLPSFDLLASSEARSGKSWLDIDLAQQRGRDLVQALANFDVLVDLEGIVPGPVVTCYDVSPRPGVKVGEIASLSNDIALALKVAGVRILGPIAGKGAIGIEVPNPQGALVRLRDVLEEAAGSAPKGDLPFVLGRSASGEAVLSDLTDMPHLLIAGATNSGKSVLIHALIVSLLYRLTPDDLKLVLIDPKRLMEVRYGRLSERCARNIKAYNQAAAKSNGFSPEPYIVVVIDELADLMMIAGKDVENSVQRLSQMARAVGIHLVLATQRPSVDIITGVIKANLPARVSLQVVSKTDSRVILDTQGAENLIGRGDMLYLASGAQHPARIQGAYVSDKEIAAAAKFWADQGPADYPEPAELLGLPDKGAGPDDSGSSEDAGDLRRALKLVTERRRVSQDLLKANFGSSARATDLLSRLEVEGFIFKPEGTNRWEIRYDRIEEYLEEGNKG